MVMRIPWRPCSRQAPGCSTAVRKALPQQRDHCKTFQKCMLNGHEARVGFVLPKVTTAIAIQVAHGQAAAAGIDTQDDGSLTTLVDTEALLGAGAGGLDDVAAAFAADAFQKVERLLASANETLECREGAADGASAASDQASESNACMLSLSAQPVQTAAGC